VNIAAQVARARPHIVAGGLCAGLAAANGLRVGVIDGASLALLLLAVAVWCSGTGRVVCAAGGLACVGLVVGGTRLTALDHSTLAKKIGHVGPALVEVTAPARHGEFNLRVPARVLGFDGEPVDEPVLLKLPLGRSPPQGARLALDAEITAPRGPEGGFDERGWLRRQGVHVVLRSREYRIVGHRGGLGGVADGLRRWLARGAVPGLEGERKAVILGVVLGADEGLSPGLRDRFRSSGLYHLLAVSGQNVAIIAGAVLVLAWMLGIPRWLGEVAVLTSIGGYVLAVGLQPSVVRAGVAGALASLAWLAARPRDRWYFLLAGAVVLLAWNPYNLLEPGFQLSFAAVSAIFLVVPRLEGRLEGYPLPRFLAATLAVSTACGLVTAPILWLDFGTVPIFSVLGNAVAEPSVPPLLGLGLLAGVIHPLFPGVAASLAWLNGWLAAYLAGCARLVGGLPHAQVGSPAALLTLVAAAGFAWTLLRR
jgi:competence protein ComEC